MNFNSGSTEITTLGRARKCRSCGESPSSLKCCSGCSKVWYCNAKCQKEDWVRHIFDCRPKRAITTADYLALAVHNNLLPEHPQTCEDYGFTRVLKGDDKSNLLGLYIGLMDPRLIGISATKIHRWRVNGTLAQNLKDEFEKLPAGSRGEYYSWFLKHQFVLASDSAVPPTKDDEGDMFKRAWRFIGNSGNDSKEDIVAATEGWHAEQMLCFLFYTLLVSQWHPGPHDSGCYIPFGFCACVGEEEEQHLAGIYRALIHKCTFEEFCAAHKSSSIVNLFESKGLGKGLSADFKQVVSSGSSHYSVWDLKQFALRPDTPDSPSTPINSVMADYGFMNVKNSTEIEVLRKAYARYFQDRRGGAIKLHQACIQGRVYEQVDSVTPLKDKMLRRLMKNLYPLAEF